MHCVSTKFHIDNSSRFPFRARTHRQTHRHTHIHTYTVTDLTTARLPPTWVTRIQVACGIRFEGTYVRSFVVTLREYSRVMAQRVGRHTFHQDGT